MRDRWMLIAATVLVSVGVLGVGALGIAERAGYLRQPRVAVRQNLDPLDVGERIYLLGVGADGRELDRFGPMLSARLMSAGGGGCASCHGADGRGGEVGMMSRIFVAPDVTYDELEDDGYTDAMIAEAIRDARDEAGEALNPLMPRWEMSDAEMDGLITYLKELSR